MKRGPKPSGKAMTAAQRQARYRAAHAEGAPRLRYCRPADRRSMAQRWRDAVGELLDLQGAYRSWLDSLPQNAVGVTPRERCGRSAISICPTSIAWSRRAALGETAKLRYVTLLNVLGWQMKKNGTPRANANSSWWTLHSCKELELN